MTSLSELVNIKIPEKQLCFFCYISIVTENQEIEKQKIKNDEIGNFFKFFEEYIGTWEKDIRLPGGKSSSWFTFSKPDNDFWVGLGRCKDCEKVVRSFCALYHQWKCLELQLEWKVKMLTDIMTSANRVPSRVKQLNDMIQETHVDNVTSSTDGIVNKTKLENFKIFRRAMTRKCSQKLANATPRVVLKRLEVNSDLQGAPFCSTLKHDIVHIENDLSAFENEVGVFIFLGWSMSMAAVALLASSTGGVSQMDSGHFSIDLNCDVDGNQEMEEGENMNVIHCQLSRSRNNLDNLMPVENQVSLLESCGLLIEKQEIVQCNNNEDFINHIQDHGSLDIINEQELELSPFDDRGPSPMDQDDFNESIALERNETGNGSADVHQSPIRSNSGNTLEEEHGNLEKILTGQIIKIKEGVENNEYFTSRENGEQIKKVHEDGYQQDDYTSSSSSEDEAELKFEIKGESTNNQQQLQSVSKRLLQCTICSKILKRRDGLRRHMIELHSASSVNQNNAGLPQLRYYHCKLCKMQFKRYPHLRRHKTTKGHKAQRKLHLKMQKRMILKRAKVFTDCSVKEIDKNSSKGEATSPISLPVNQQVQKEPTIECERQEETKEYGKLKDNAKEVIPITNKNDKTSPVPQKRYSLRGNLKKSYHGMATGDNDNPDKTEDTNFQLDDHRDNFLEVQESSSSESDHDANSVHSSVISDVDTESDEDNRPRKRKFKESERTHLYCNLDSCDKYRLKKELFKNHQTLHAPGKHNCHFCKIVEPNVIKLSEHERTTHSSDIGASSDETKFNCPRCSFGTNIRMEYHWHFAEVHVGGFKRKKAECPICEKKLGKKQSEKEHFKMYHDTTGMEPELIHDCTAEGCTAYFKTEKQLSEHFTAKHKLKNKVQVQLKKDVERKMEKKLLPFSEENGKITCNYCKKVFAKYGSFDEHKRNFHKISNKFICKVKQCLYRFKTLENLKTHQKLHGEFKCNFCDVVKCFAPDLCLHEMEHAFRPEPTSEQTERLIAAIQTFNCPRCSFSCDRESYYVRHHLKTHVNLISTAYTCSICSAEGMTNKFLRIHFKSHHKTDGLDASQIWKCDKCSAYFLTNYQLNQHKMRIHNNGSTTCPECSKICKSVLSLKFHMENMHPNSFFNPAFRCDYPACKRRFSSQKRLDDHISKVHGSSSRDKVIKCTKCSKEFKGEQRLKNHMNVVHVIPSFVCSICGKVFKSKTNLANHMEYHNPDSWKFPCPTCGKKLATNQKLEEHMRTHTKEKPFICQFCGEKYAHRHNWRNHIKSKHSEGFYELEHNKDAKKTGNYLSRKGSKKGDLITAGTKA